MWVWQEKGELTLAWAGPWTGGSLKVILAYKIKLHADAEAASDLREKKSSVAGAAEGYRW